MAYYITWPDFLPCGFWDLKNRAVSYIGDVKYRQIPMNTIICENMKIFAWTIVEIRTSLNKLYKGRIAK